jgi:hypothetical protein
MAKTIYKAAAMTELWNHDVWRLLMPSEMMVCVHDGDGSIFARVRVLLKKKEMASVFCVTELPVSVFVSIRNMNINMYLCGRTKVEFQRAVIVSQVPGSARVIVFGIWT